jgi:peptidoglycan/LPS O-acetylase OafA/YrhL
MIPLLVLFVVTMMVRIAGFAGWTAPANWQVSLVAGLAAMFILTASAHWEGDAKI